MCLSLINIVEVENGATKGPLWVCTDGKCLGILRLLPNVTFNLFIYDVE